MLAQLSHASRMTRGRDSPEQRAGGSPARREPLAPPSRFDAAGSRPVGDFSVNPRHRAGRPIPNWQSVRGHHQLDLADLRLAGIDAVLGEDRHEVLTEGLEGLLGLPDVEDVDAVADAESGVERPAGRVVLAYLLELRMDSCELFRGHSPHREVDAECHETSPVVGLLRWTQHAHRRVVWSRAWPPKSTAIGIDRLPGQISGYAVRSAVRSGIPGQGRSG